MLQVVDKIMAGVHGTVFAYGATGSGKTYSMAGGNDNPGVMYLMIHDLFSKIHACPHPVKIKASYLEIYNENVVDLLNEEENPPAVEIREDPQAGVSLAGITEYDMTNAADVFKILRDGGKNRTVDSHLLNAASSRSHAVFMITVAQYAGLPKDASNSRGKSGAVGSSESELLQAAARAAEQIAQAGTVAAKFGRLLRSANLTMIDLAGSERAKKSGTNKKMLREGAKINRSLLALANCINALGEKKKGTVRARASDCVWVLCPCN